jgi:magnesium transporter
MVTGVFGQNFDRMPLLHTTWGFPVVTAILLLVCGGLYRGFKSHGWL